MEMITTEAWVLHQGSRDNSAPAELRKEDFSFSDITDDEVLAEPIYGCWEANMTHALKRHPVDVCRLRREKRIVLGNAGVARVLRTGRSVTSVREGDICLIVPVTQLDKYGYMLKVFGYDAPNTIGMLAKRTKLNQEQIYKVPEATKYSLHQWAAFSIKYATAWDNWKIALGCLRLQMAEDDCPSPHVWGWGGGAALAELALAKIWGCRAAMIASEDKRLQLIRDMGITAIDRREFIDLDFDENRYQSDRQYKTRYMRAEKLFLSTVEEHTNGAGVSIFIDNIGTPVLRATLKALGRQGVITTVGWDRGKKMSFSRIGECTNRHIHVHTHGARYSEGILAARFAEEVGWMPPVDGNVYSWDCIPQLAEDYAQRRISTYFPIFEVNAL
jgi:NADPH:quinone reductase-like Zn-dependent oxidoreductase